MFLSYFFSRSPEEEIYLEIVKHKLLCRDSCLIDNRQENIRKYYDLREILK
jgi:hypothetical protein